ncbi:hypothetical protein [Halodurantibacterium flavum]|uniref:Alpha/beta hydrolase n=1 Tax=Halodurantibacterium flavum TaxID=1382802 RepID=A0ABW4S5I3_9RHOB
MPLLPVNLHKDGTLRDASGGCARQSLGAHLARLDPGAPVIVMIHGFRYSPFGPGNDPHRHIFAAAPERGLLRTVSWPRRLGIRETGGPLGLAFGWDGCGRLDRVHGRAQAAGRALSRLLQAVPPGRPVHMVAHSLGVRVALAALDGLEAGAAARMILLAAASYRNEARAALVTPAGRRAEFVNVTGRENALFDALAEMLLPAPCPLDRVLGRGLTDAPHRWLDLPLDDPRLLSALRTAGFRIAPPAPVCHWSGYLRPGVFGLYRALLSDDPLPLARLRALLPAEPAPRARLLAIPPLPLGRKAS